MLEAEVAEAIRDGLMTRWDCPLFAATTEDLQSENAGFILQLETGHKYAVVVTLIEEGQ